MYLEITAPAVCIEYENNARVTVHGEVSKEVDVEMPNPNLDYYLISDEWLIDHSRVTIDGRTWELDLSEAEITLELTIDEVRESAKMRAAEDYVTEGEVLEQWARYRHSPKTVQNAYNETVYGEPTPQTHLTQ